MLELQLYLPLPPAALGGGPGLEMVLLLHLDCLSFPPLPVLPPVGLGPGGAALCVLGPGGGALGCHPLPVGLGLDVGVALAGGLLLVVLGPGGLHAGGHLDVGPVPGCHPPCALSLPDPQILQPLISIYYDPELERSHLKMPEL